MAKKRYYQNPKDRLAESRGMERALYRRMMQFDEPYAGMEPRRRQEMEDSGMIKEDHSQMANLPQEVMMKPWPMYDYSKYNLDDTIRGIDVQMDDDVGHEKRGAYPEKY